MAKAKKVPAKCQFPEVLYVPPGVDGLFDAEAELACFDDGDVVGIYQFVETRTVRITADIV